MTKHFVCLKDSKSIKPLKCLLENLGLFDKGTKISLDETFGGFLVSLVDDITSTALDNLISSIKTELPSLVFEIVTKEVNNTSGTLSQKVADMLTRNTECDEFTVNLLIERLPKRFSIYPPLLLLPPGTLDTEIWQSVLKDLSQDCREELLTTILKYYSTKTNQLTHLAVNNPIPESNNEIRSPTQLLTLYGDFTNFWCHTVQNGIYQTWMPTHTMFSRGNIKEKARILSSYQDISDSTDVVDMYAGIGYFTLSYLKRGARRLFCWEINPYSVDGLVKGIEKNGFGPAYVILSDQKVSIERVLQSRCVIFLESNDKITKRFKEMIAQENDKFKLGLNISHINLGLLPKSTDSWSHACNIIDCYGATTSWLHVHENVGVSDLANYMKKTGEELQLLSQRTVTPVWLEKVKTFAPDVYHIVGDFNLI